MMFKNYLSVTAAYLVALLLITVTTFVVVKILSPFALAIILKNVEWISENSIKAIKIIIVAITYTFFIIFYAIVLLKTSTGIRVLDWFVRTNRRVGLDLSRDAINKRIDRIGSNKSN